MRRALAGVALAGGVLFAACSGCPPPYSTAGLSRVSTLDGAAPASFGISVHLPSPSCGAALCNFCGDPTASVTLSFDAAWSTAPGTSATDAPVVRFTLAPIEAAPPDAVSPPLPVDLLLPDAGSASTTITVAAACTDGPPCDVGFTLTLARVERVPVGAVKVTWSALAGYHSSDGPVIASTP